MTSLQNLYEIQLVVNVYGESKQPPVTHSSDLPKVVPYVYSQTLGCNVPAPISTLPHIHKRTGIQRVLLLVVVNLNFQWPRKQGFVVTNPVHRAQALPADLWFEAIQRLIDRVRWFECLFVCNVGAYLVYYIDKCLGIVSRETSNCLNLIIVQEDCSD